MGSKEDYLQGRQTVVPTAPNKDYFPLLALPPELILLISAKLPYLSRAYFALTSKALFSITSDPMLFEGLKLPPESTLHLTLERTSQPQLYQPMRWEFLRVLESYLNGSRYLCSECFTLHRRKVFTNHDYYQLGDSDLKSCRHEDIRLGNVWNDTYAHSGIVDICPCIKMTFAKKRRIEAWLREKAQDTGSDGHPARNFWSHECRHTYGEIKVEMQVALFLYDGTELAQFGPNCISGDPTTLNSQPMRGQLGAVFKYRHIFPTASEQRSPRLLCPHRLLDTAIKDLVRCRARHGISQTSNVLCRNIEYCYPCRTKILDLCNVEDSTAGTTCCSYRVERCFDDAFWPYQTVFPSERQKLPLQRRSLLPLSGSQ